MLAADAEEALHLEHIAGARIRTSLKGERKVLSQRLLKHLGELERDLDRLLLAKVEQTDAQANEAGHRTPLERFHRLLHEQRHQRLRNLLVARACEAQPERERSDGGHLEGRLVVDDHGQQRLEHLVLLGTGVCEPKAEDRRGLDVHWIGPLSVLGEESQCGIALVPSAAREHANSEQRARLDVLVCRVEELVDLRETTVDVPEQQHTERGRRRHHAVLLVLVEPLVTLGEQQLVRAEPDVEQRVHKGRCEVLARRVHIRRPRGPLLEVRLVYVLGHLGLDDVEVARELEVMLCRMRAVHDARELVLGLGSAAGT